MKLIYCATPSRLTEKTKDIMDYVTGKHLAPFHPFQAFELARFEHGPIGREKTLEFCCRAIGICDEFWLFGISAGSLYELQFADELAKGGQEMPILFIPDFDPEWKTYWRTLAVGLERFEKLFGDLDLNDE
jgi:hypothetical protein